MHFLHEEKKAVAEVAALGKRFGFGNLIDRLRIAWSLHLLEFESSFSVKDAMRAAGIQDDARIKRAMTGSRETYIGWAEEYIGKEGFKVSSSLSFKQPDSKIGLNNFRID